MRYYDRNLIITLITGMPLTLLTYSCVRYGQKTDVIVLTADDAGHIKSLSEEDTLKLKKLTGQSRLYVFGHCDKGSDIIADNHKLVIHYTQLAHLIAANVNHDAIPGLRLAIFGCHAAVSSQPNLNDSFAAKLHHQLAHYGISNIDLTAYSDSKSIRMSGDTFQIYKISKEDKHHFDTLPERRYAALALAKQRFLETIIESLRPDTYDYELIPFIKNELTVEKMLDKNYLQLFMQACTEEFINHKLYSLFDDAPSMSHALVNKLVHEIDRLAKMAICAAASDLIKTVKHIDRIRPNSKVLFTWYNGVQTQLDANQVKRMDEDHMQSISQKNPIMGYAFQAQRSFIDKLCFLNRANRFQNLEMQDRPIYTNQDTDEHPDLTRKY